MYTYVHNTHLHSQIYSHYSRISVWQRLLLFLAVLLTGQMQEIIGTCYNLETSVRGQAFRSSFQTDPQ